MAKWEGWLIVGLAALQVITLNRLGQVERAMNQQSVQTAQSQQALLRSLNQVENQVNRTAEAQRWVSDPQVSVQPGSSCADGHVQIGWNLLKAVPGTKARLLYRRGEGEEWHEAQVAAGSAQSYTASFPITGGPGLDWIVWLDDRTRAPGAARPPAWNYYPPASVQARAGGAPSVPAYQYQILAEGPGMSNSTGPLTAPLGRELTVGAGFNVTVSTGGQYQASAEQPPNVGNPCLQIKQVTARVFAGDREAGTYPLAVDGQRLAATWQSGTPLTRLELVVKYGDSETVIPVDLTAK